MQPSQMIQPNSNIYNPNTNYQASYDQAASNTQGAQQNLASTQRSMSDPGQMYSQNLSNAQSMYGFNPQDLLRANQNLAHTQTVMANLPQAVQQQGAYYGTTAGSEANNYAQQAGNLQPVLAGQSNTVGAFQNVLNATQQQAQQQAQLSYQGQQLQLQAAQDQVANALGFQNAAQAEQAGYGQYVTSVAQAQAQQESASAAMSQANTAQSMQQQQLNAAAANAASQQAILKALQQQQAPAQNPQNNHQPTPVFGNSNQVGWLSPSNIRNTFFPQHQAQSGGGGF